MSKSRIGVEYLVDYTKALCKIKSVEPILICESGSRAWGFANENSDYDIRIIYIEDPIHYITGDSLDNFTHVSDDKRLDVVGWNFSKAYRLARNGNITPHMWIRSMTYYCYSPEIQNKLFEIFDNLFIPRKAIAHCCGIVKGHLNRYYDEEFERTEVKKMLYILYYLKLAEYIWVNRKLPDSVNFDYFARELGEDNFTSMFDFCKMVYNMDSRFHVRLYKSFVGIMRDKCNRFVENMDENHINLDNMSDYCLTAELYEKVFGIKL